MDSELENFKRQVNLVELAASYGYAVIRKESCRTSIVMKNPAQGSKIVVATDDKDGHGIFFEVHGNATGGSVIDFVMYQEGCNLGKARVKLRDYTGRPRLHFPVKEYAKPQPTTRDRAHTAVTWQKGKPYSGGYLEGRGLTEEIISLFSEHIRLIATPDGKHQNIAFRHDDQAGLTGWEVKNKGFTGFVGGGGKALFACQVGEQGPPSRIVISESAIDAMTYCQLSQKPGLYISIAGSMSPEQEKLLKATLTDNPQAKIITATDADRMGEKYAMFIHSIRPDARRMYPARRDHPDKKYKDWNDVLVNRPMQLEAGQAEQHTGRGHTPETAREPAPDLTPVGSGQGKLERSSAR